MAGSRSGSPIGMTPLEMAILTPGPLGHNDYASPENHSSPGDTPGPVGMNDFAAHSISRCAEYNRSPELTSKVRAVMTPAPGAYVKLNESDFNGRDHAGCGLVLLPQISDGITLDLIQGTKWLELRIISAAGTGLRSEPLISQQPASSVPKGTIVGVLAEKEGWLLVEAADMETRKKGWIQAGETTTPKPPRTK